jgi:alkyl hydroperoxide reductase subunit AhpF
MRHAKALYNLYSNLRNEADYHLDNNNDLILKLMLNGHDTSVNESIQDSLKKYIYNLGVASQYYYLACHDCRDRVKPIQIGSGK